MTRTLAAIFFDIDDTLFSTSVFADKARRAAIDAMISVGLRCDRDSLQKELEEVLAEFSSNYANHFDKLLQRLPPEASAGLNPALVVAAGVVAYHETKWSELKVYDDVYEVLSWLANCKLIRGIISAGLNIKQAEKIIRLKIYEFISPNAIFITEQLGINKPNPKVYLRALNELGLSPENAMYVGDHPLHDIDPCNEVGMVTVRIRRSGKHSDEIGRSKPDFEIRDFYGLRKILREEFGLGA